MRHAAGTIFLARYEPGTAGSEFCIDLQENASLDFGGDRKPDGLGFAVFGRFVHGMDVVRRIYRLRATGIAKDPDYTDQIFETPVKIMSVTRIPSATLRNKVVPSVRAALRRQFPTILSPACALLACRRA